MFARADGDADAAGEFVAAVADQDAALAEGVADLDGAVTGSAARRNKASMRPSASGPSQPAAADRVTQPVTILTPVIDGLVTDFFEWRGAGTITTQPPLGAMWKAEGLFTAIYFGWSHDHLCLRLDPDEAAQPRQNGLGMEITLHGPGHSFRLACSLAPSGPEFFTLFQQGEGETWQEIGPYRSICRRTVLELAIPTKDLHLEPEQEVRMSLVILEHGLEAARYPHHTPAVLTVPGPEFEAGLWRV